jgi:hypothetical protein
MTDFRCVPIPSETAERFRRSGIDDAGNRLRRVISTGRGEPCRHCLRDACAGETLLLGSYNLPHPQGIYWTPSPIFVHAEPCPAFDRVDTVAPIVRGRLVSVRAYDEAEQCLYDLGHAGEGDAIDAPLAQAIADPRTAFVNIHTAKPGCLLCAVERAADQPR